MIQYKQFNKSFEKRKVITEIYRLRLYCRNGLAREEFKLNIPIKFACAYDKKMIGWSCRWEGRQGAYETWTRKRKRGKKYTVWVYVHKLYRKQGIGKQLIKLAKSGISHDYLFYDEDNSNMKFWNRIIR